MACNGKSISVSKINSLLSNLRAKGYEVYKEPYRLNIIGVRNPNTNPQKFDDYIYVIYKDDNNRWVGRRYNATTDPSTIYLEKGGFKSSTTGTAIMPEGQYVDTYKLGTHGTESPHTALKQDKSFCVYRDYNRDNLLNFDIDSKQCGNYRLNIHRARAGGADDGQGNTEFIGRYSAGCQVFQNSYCFDEFIDLAQQHRSRYGNKFTYTLLDKSLRNKFILKRSLLIGGIIGGGLLIFLGIKKLKK